MSEKAERYHRYTMTGAACLLMLLCAFSLWISGRDESVQPQEEAIMTSAVGSMEEFVIERAQLREQQMRQLNGIIEDDRTSDEIRASAQRQLMQLCTWMEQEATIEGVLRTRGFDRVIATVHTDSANILVRTQNLTQEDANAILELVARETGLLGGNIKIIPLNSP